jgi:hypothetical protein
MEQLVRKIGPGVIGLRLPGSGLSPGNLFLILAASSQVELPFQIENKNEVAVT